MGLDQYAGSRGEDTNEIEVSFQWRKHAKLQEYMEQLWYANNTEEFNCVDLELSREDIVKLHKMIIDEDMPVSEGGFFYGHQFQDESASEYKEYDEQFCEWALREIDAGRKVFYHCWW